MRLILPFVHAPHTGAHNWKWFLTEITYFVFLVISRNGMIKRIHFYRSFYRSNYFSVTKNFTTTKERDKNKQSDSTLQLKVNSSTAYFDLTGKSEN